MSEHYFEKENKALFSLISNNISVEEKMGKGMYVLVNVHHKVSAMKN